MSSSNSQDKEHSRRNFLKKTAAATAMFAGSNIFTLAAKNISGEDQRGEDIPWYRSLTRWGQTNITEIDPLNYDIPWWRSYWKRTRTQGVIVNAGGIVAYYPSNVPFHQQAQFLEGRDLFGDLCRAAHEDGLAVFARMDSNLAHEELYEAHPDWFAVNEFGNPYTSGDLYIACVNGPYYERHIPAILREIIERYQPEGFTDNRWHGLGRNSICYCENCRKRFYERSGRDLPQENNWDDPAFREWIRWNYDRRLEIWELNNRTTKSAGGDHCTWSGMNSASINTQSASFRNYKEICNRADILMLDYQSRRYGNGLQHNAETGKLIHGLLGWDKLIPESMAMYLNQGWGPVFRVASQPEPEARMWAVSGMAGGIQPWWHHVGAYHEDRRMYRTVEPLLRWHEAHEEYLIERSPVANVGVVWSQQNMDFYGRDNSGLLVEQPWRGMTQALLRGRVPYLPVHADHIDRDAEQLSVLVLPNTGVMTDEQVASVRRFVDGGGGLVATGQSSLFDEWGDPRADYALGDLFGAHVEQAYGDHGQATDFSAGTRHSYLRLSPELRGQVGGPQTGEEPLITGERHEVFEGFEETDILPFGGSLEPLRIDDNAEVLMTYVPSFPIYPPETAWMREPSTDIPGLVLNTTSRGGRIAFLPADLDRQFARNNFPDHANVLSSLVRWAANGDIPLVVEGAGLVDCHLYRQSGRMILHLVNLTGEGTWREPMHELIPAGPQRVQVRLSDDVPGRRLRLLVSGEEKSADVSGGWASFVINSIDDHEVVVIS